MGGIPFGLLLAKFFAGIDIRQYGSGNIGATNVLRVLKEKNPPLAKKLSITTVALDALKGAIVILVAMSMDVAVETQWAIAVIAVLGHCFSPYLMFEGGKGVATSFGVLFIMLPIESAIGLAVWFLGGKYLKVSSISSLLGISALVLSSLAIHPEIESIGTHAPVFIIAFLIFYKHIPNIIRLFEKKEGAVI